MGISTSSFNKDRGEALIQLLMIVPEDKFDMIHYRKGDISMHECNSVGCMIGHATILDTPENIEKAKKGGYGISFDEWSRNFFFNSSYWYSSETVDELHNFLFSANHNRRWSSPMIKHAIARVRYVIDNHELRSDWKDQLRNSNLFYMPQTD